MEQIFMKKINLLAIVFCFNLCSINIFAQQLQLSATSIDEISLGYTKVIGQDEDGYFVLMSNLSLNSESDRVGFKNRKYKLTYFNTALNLVWEKNLESFSNDAVIDAVTFFNGKIVVISSLQKRSENLVNYYVTTYDNSGMPIQNDKPITSFSAGKYDYEKSKVILSSGRNRIMIVTREYSGDNTQTVFAAVLDTSFTELEKKNVIIPFPVKSFDVTGYVVSDKNDVLLLGLSSEKIKVLSSKRKIDYYLYSSRTGDTVFKEFKISSDKNITGLGVAFDNINNLAVFAGFFSERESYTGSGILYATLDMALNDEVKIKTTSLDGPQNSRLRGERNSASGLSLIGYPIDRIVLRDDGGAVIVAEAAYTTEYSYYDSFSQSFTRRLEYHFESVAVISINVDGSIHWNAVVEKDQVSMDDGGVFSSFCSLLNSENLVILYNAEITKRNKVLFATIDNKGTPTKGTSIASTEGLLLLPKSGKQVGENAILVPAYLKRKLYLALFTL